MLEYHESITAKLCAFVRAYHAIYSEHKIFDDYLAYNLMGQHQFIKMAKLIENDFDLAKLNLDEPFSLEKIQDKVENLLSPIPLFRIAHTEQALQEFAKGHPHTQYVILGAGLDTYSFRNFDEGITIFELDHPVTSHYKMQTIESLGLVKPNNTRFVQIDFDKDNLIEILLENGFNPKFPAFFSILGVSYYLQLPIFAKTISMLKEIMKAPSAVIFDYPDETTLSLKDKDSRVFKLAKMTQSLGETMQHGYSLDEIKQVFKDNDIELFEHLSPKKINDLYFKNHSNLRAFENVHLVQGLFN